MDARLAATRLLEAGRVGVPGRRGIEHGAAADGRPVAQDDAVAARGDDRRGETQLRDAACLPTRAGTAAVPWWTWSRAPSAIGSSSSSATSSR